MPQPAINHPHNEETGEQTRARLAASGWRRDAQLERLTRMKTDNPDAYNALPANVRMSVGYYANAKAAAKAYGIDTTAPDAA